MSDADEGSVGGLDLDSLVRRWRLLVGLLVFGGLLGTLLMQQRDIPQVASASIVVRFPGSSTLFGNLSPDQSEPERHVAQQAAILSSSGVATGAIERLDELIPDHGYVLDTFRQQMGVGVREETDIIEIRFVDQNRDIALAAVDAILASFEEFSAQRNTNYSAALAELEESISATTATIESLQAEVGELAESEEPADIDKRALLTERRDQAVQRESALLARRDQLAVDAALETSTFDLVSAPSASKSDEGSWVLGAVAGIVLGGAVGLSAVYWLENGRRTVDDARRLESLVGAPVLADLPAFRSELPMTIRESNAADRIWTLSRMLEPATKNGVETTSSVIAFVSPHADHHRTLVAVNTAIALAMTERPVVILSTETRRDGLRELLERYGAPSRGVDLAEVVRDPARARWATRPAVIRGAPMLDALTCKALDRSPRDLFASPRFAQVIDRLSDHYAAVVLDVPGILDEEQGVDVVRRADRVVAVMTNPARVRDCRELRRHLQLHSLAIDGCVFVASGDLSSGPTDTSKTVDLDDRPDWGTRTPQSPRQPVSERDLLLPRPE